MLGLGWTDYGWKNYDWPALRLAYPRPFSSENERTLTFACKRSDSFDPEKVGAQDQSDWSIVQHADDYLQGLLLRWASSQLLYEHARRIAVLRDLSARNTRRHATIKRLKEVRQLIVTESLDLEVAAHEIRQLASSELEFRYNVIEFLEANPTLRGHPREAHRLLESLRRSQLDQAQELVDELRVLVGSLSTASNITAAISNIQIQRLLLLLAAASIAVASWAAVRASESPSQVPSHPARTHLAPRH